jgi:hypothetical protein
MPSFWDIISGVGSSVVNNSVSANRNLQAQAGNFAGPRPFWIEGAPESNNPYIGTPLEAFGASTTPDGTTNSLADRLIRAGGYQDHTESVLHAGSGEGGDDRTTTSEVFHSGIAARAGRTASFLESQGFTPQQIDTFMTSTITWNGQQVNAATAFLDQTGNSITGIVADNFFEQALTAYATDPVNTNLAIDRDNHFGTETFELFDQNTGTLLSSYSNTQIGDYIIALGAAAVAGGAVGAGLAGGGAPSGAAGATTGIGGPGGAAAGGLGGAGVAGGGIGAGGAAVGAGAGAAAIGGAAGATTGIGGPGGPAAGGLGGAGVAGGGIGAGGVADGIGAGAGIVDAIGTVGDAAGQVGDVLGGGSAGGTGSDGSFLGGLADFLSSDGGGALLGLISGGLDAYQANELSELSETAANLADPFRNERGQYQELLRGLYNDPNEALRLDPGYQFRFDQGLEALERVNARQGQRLSGNALIEAEEFGQGLASQEFGQVHDRLANLSGVNAGAPGAAANLFLSGQQASQQGYQNALFQAIYGLTGGAAGTGGGGGSPSFEDVGGILNIINQAGNVLGGDGNATAQNVGVPDDSTQGLRYDVDGNLIR